VVEFSAHMTGDDVVSAEHMPPLIKIESDNKKDKPEKLSDTKPLNMIIKEAEMSRIKLLLQKYGVSVEGKKKAAAELGISLATLYNKLKQDSEG